VTSNGNSCGRVAAMRISERHEGSFRHLRVKHSPLGAPNWGSFQERPAGAVGAFYDEPRGPSRPRVFFEGLQAAPGVSSSHRKLLCPAPRVFVSVVMMPSRDISASA
jgi:hypothetical protein